MPRGTEAVYQTIWLMHALMIFVAVVLAVGALLWAAWSFNLPTRIGAIALVSALSLRILARLHVRRMLRDSWKEGAIAAAERILREARAKSSGRES